MAGPQGHQRGGGGDPMAGPQGHQRGEGVTPWQGRRGISGGEGVTPWQGRRGISTSSSSCRDVSSLTNVCAPLLVTGDIWRRDLGRHLSREQSVVVLEERQRKW